MRFKYGMLFALLLTGLVALSVTPQAKSDEGTAPKTVEASSSESDAAVELPDERTATSDTYELEGGALETRVYGGRVNFRDAANDWEPIDQDLDPLPGGGISNGANSFDLRLPDEIGDGAVRLADEGEWLSYRLLGQETEAAELDGATASYDAGNGALFELHSLGNGLKEEITLKNPMAPRLYRFELDFSKGLAPTLQEDGSIAVRDEDGSYFATLPEPTIADAGGSPVTEPVHYSLREGPEAGRWTLTIEADEAWVSDPERSWPITIDPSAFIGTAKDCTIGSTPLPNGWRACGSTGATELIAAYSQIEKQPVRTFLQFELGSWGQPPVPANAYIGKALIKLYAPKAAENTAPGLETRQVTLPWNTNLDWAHRSLETPWYTPGGDFSSGGHAEVLTAQRSNGAGPGWWEFSSSSLRELAQGWVEYNTVTYPPVGIQNKGIVVKQIDETRTSACESSGTCPRRFVGFNSSATASNKPELDLIYYPKAPATNKMISPMEGTTTARRLQLRAAWAPGVTGLRFQYRANKKGPFNDIPPSLLRNARGEPVEELAVSESCCQSERLYFDAAHVTSELQSQGGTIQVRALFEGGTGAGFSSPVEAKIDRRVGGPDDAMTPIGPGTLDLLTGNLNLSETDVSIGGFNSLSFSRSYNTRDPGKAGATTVLGQGWSSGAEAEGGSEWEKLNVTSWSETIEGQTYSFEYVTLSKIKGLPVAFEKDEGQFIAPPELAGYALTTSEGTYILTDPDGNRTTFSNANSGNAGEYLPVSITQPGSGPHSTLMTWNYVNGQRRLVREVAPTAQVPGVEVNCSESPTTKQACRTLEFTYVPASTWGAPSSYGERLQKITFYASGQGGPWTVAEYRYDTQGRLVAEWDPRISPRLETVYTYEGEKLRKVTPPGQEPWTLRYTTAALDGESGPLRLKGVERLNLLGGQTMTSIRYEVPLSGGNAPYDMSPAKVGTWGQGDLPADATAVFPPTQVPAEPATSYEKATVYYMDAQGFEVNVAAPAEAGMSGASISTTETDEYGNITRELTAQNRLRALAEPEGKTAERSHLLESKFTYSDDGTELLDERGPLHRVKLQESGEVTEARLHRTVAYENPENLNPAPLVPTREQSGAIFPGKGIEADQRVTELRYNWKLRSRTATIVDSGVGHLNITRSVNYEGSTGLPIEKRQPKAYEESGKVPGTTRTIYYGEFSEFDGCYFNTKWAGLPCRIEPAAQPVTGPKLPITRITAYSPLNKPTEIIEETPGAGEAGTRRTVVTYDAAGRQISRKVTAGGGQPVPKVEFFYSSVNGMLTTERFACETSECGTFDSQANTTVYDALGRVSSYEDADGNRAETVYDSYGRPSSYVDGKGTQSLEYDAVSGRLTKLTDSAAGVFTASYDADGQLIKRNLPNGLIAEATYDPTGVAVGLRYTKASSCGASCTWLDFALDRSIFGQALSESSTLGTDRFTYDRAGRLNEAQESPAQGNCRTRSYSYDKDANRVSSTSIASALGGACGTGSSTERTYSYDKADRLTDPGVVYDSFGRITSLPAGDAGGNGLTTSYFVTNTIAMQSQGGVTNTFELDASLRQRTRLQGGGGLEGTEVLHYDNPGDSPTWTQRGSAWTRNIGGIAGELAAVQESGKEIWLPLTNLHGDVVAMAAINPAVTALQGTYSYDEYGNATSGTSGRFGWLGGLQRRTELPSGIVQMGVRSYVPAIGRFLSKDPVNGGSANPYDYANADPINQSDPLGTKPYDNACDGGVVGCQCTLHIKMWSPTSWRMGVRFIRQCNRFGGIDLYAWHIWYWVDEQTGYGFVEMSPPHYLNHYPGDPSCRDTDPCQNHWDHSGTFECHPGWEYQIGAEWQYKYNSGREVGDVQTLTVKAQEFCL